MTKEKAVAPSALSLFLHELFRGEIYKRTQGKMARQLTCIAIWVAFAVGAWSMWYKGDWVFVKNWMVGFGMAADSAATVMMSCRYGIPSVVLILGIWVGYRLVNYAPFADFLIAVEAEMHKVSWPSQTVLVRSSVVVIVMILGLTAVVFSYDLILRWFLRLFHIVA